MQASQSRQSSRERESSTCGLKYHDVAIPTALSQINELTRPEFEEKEKKQQSQKVSGIIVTRPKRRANAKSPDGQIRYASGSQF